MLEKVQEDRANKLKAVRELGFDPYGCRYDNAVEIAKVHAEYEKWETAAGGPEEAKKVETKLRGNAAGRVMLYRDMGKMIFAHIRDESHPTGIQIALRKPKGDAFTPGALNEKEFQLAKLLDLGDIIAVEGPMERTKTGEVTIWSEKLTLLCKSLNPMPEKWHGLTDVETRYRQRYLDLMTNPESMVTFQKRVAILETFRSLLKERGFSEVETPTLQSIYGGAAARPFLTHHNALDIDLFMRISPELYLKRLLVGGMQKVFEIGRNFRNEGIDTRHNPEFTMMELYQAYADYEVMMEITEELVSTAAELYVDAKTLFETGKTLTEEARLLINKLPYLREEEKKFTIAADKCDGLLLAGMMDLLAKNRQDEFGVLSKEAESLLAKAKAYVESSLLAREGTVALPYYDKSIDYTRPWPRRKYADLIKEYAGVDWKDDAAVRAKARELRLTEANKDLAVVVNDIFELVCEPRLADPEMLMVDGLEIPVIRPTFVIDYPAAICPLTRRKADDPTVALRFECFVAGMEIANAYTELNDPAIQEENFAQQLRGEAEGETMRVMDEDFVAALRHGMPPAGGLGVGIDRVVMLLTNRQSIRDVVLFPLLRPLA